MLGRKDQNDRHLSDSANVTLSVAIYLLHTVVSSVGAFLFCMAAGAVLEQTPASRLADSVFTRPPYIGFAIIGFIAGILMSRRLHSASAKWAWVLPFFILLIEILPDARSGDFRTILSYLLARGCGGCIDQLLIISPFIGSAAYSLGAWLALKRPTTAHLTRPGI